MLFSQVKKKDYIIKMAIGVTGQKINKTYHFQIFEILFTLFQNFETSQASLPSFEGVELLCNFAPVSFHSFCKF